MRPSDPATIASVAAFIALVAFAACDIPASRATRVDPGGLARRVNAAGKVGLTSLLKKSCGVRL